MILKKGSLNHSKRIDVTDIRELLAEDISYLPSSYVGVYGISYQLKKFSGINIDVLFNKCMIEHGLGLRRAVCQIEVMHPVSHILTFSPYREEVIKELTDITPIAIGPYIAYAEDYRSAEDIKEWKKKKRVLLVMPSHSIPGIEAYYSKSQFIQQIEMIKKKFDLVMVCMYFEDLKRGMWKPYQRKGYCIVSAGNTGSPFFLSRLKYIFSISDAVIANAITTGMAYAMYMDRPISLIHQQINYKVTNYNNAYNLELGLEEQITKINDLFAGTNFIITKEQIEFGKYMFGLDNKKNEKEMKKLLMSLSRLDR